MKIKIKINGRKWKISWVNENSEKLLCDGVKCYGVTHFDKRRIYLNNSQPVKEFEKTIIHELTHAFLYSYGVELDKTGERTEETVCEFAEKHIKKILKLSRKITKAWEIEMIIGAFS